MKTKTDIDNFLSTIERFPDDDTPTSAGLARGLEIAYEWTKTGVIDKQRFTYMLAKLFMY